jgi:hypothetical protein
MARFSNSKCWAFWMGARLPVNSVLRNMGTEAFQLLPGTRYFPFQLVRHSPSEKLRNGIHMLYFQFWSIHGFVQTYRPR